MTPNGNSANTSYEAIQAAITMLAKLNRRWRKTGRKRALYRYLQTVFDLYTAWKRSGDTRTAANRIAKLAGLPHQPNRHPIRAIIDATSSSDRKSKSRWTQALRYAWRHRSKWKDLERCLRANGGVAGCAARWADGQAELRTPPAREEVDLGQIAAKVTEVLADLVLSAAPEDRTALLADVVANLGHLVIEKGEQLEAGGELQPRRH